MIKLYSKLSKVQQSLKAPKNQHNNHGNFKYRNCEDILEAVKPLLAENGLMLIITDQVIQVSNRIYLEATVKLFDLETGLNIEVKASAREEESKKGMDTMQLTGATSSYARKYALNGLFNIDDSKDADDNNNDKSKVPQNNEEIQNLEAEKVKNLGNLLHLVDKDNKESLLADLTSFTDKEGKVVVGIRDFNKLKGQRLNIAYSKAQKLYPEQYKKLQGILNKTKNKG